LVEAVADFEFGGAEAGFGGSGISVELNTGTVAGGGAKENERGGAGIEDELMGFAVDSSVEAGATIGIVKGELKATGGGKTVESDLAFVEIEEVAVKPEPGLAENTVGIGVSDGGEDHLDFLARSTGDTDLDDSSGADGGAGESHLFDAGEGRCADAGGDPRAQAGGRGTGVNDHTEWTFAV
jgi:hypothetical protein